MSEYRRVRIAGGCFFFTVNLAARGDNGLLVRHVADLRAVIAEVRRTRPFRIDACVVLPDHCTASGRCRRATTTTPSGGG